MSKQQQLKQPQKLRRNPVAHAAILRKGGVHEKCRSSKRQSEKRKLDTLVSEYVTVTKTATVDSGCFVSDRLSTDI
jgi:hypothetical protein